MQTQSSPSIPHPRSVPIRALVLSAGALGLLLAPAVGLPACSDAQASIKEPVTLAELENRVAALESKEEIRTILQAFAAVVDASDPAGIAALAPKLHTNFVLDAIDFDGKKFHFEGLEDVMKRFGPLLVEADANLAPSAIDVKLDGDTARASFKFINSVKPPPQLGLDVKVKVLLFAANSAAFVREDGVWKLLSIELVHSLAYPGSIDGLRP